ncbi:hypothetical protein Avbf_14178 [Armadillidium vulgare]|nr:hypothetical protein Avbf_14178 [Armadillidium vulgare]
MNMDIKNEMEIKEELEKYSLSNLEIKDEIEIKEEELDLDIKDIQMDVKEEDIEINEEELDVVEDHLQNGHHSKQISTLDESQVRIKNKKLLIHQHKIEK